MPGLYHSCPPSGSRFVSRSLERDVPFQFQPPFSPTNISLHHESVHSPLSGGYNPSNYYIDGAVTQNNGLSVEIPYINFQPFVKDLTAEEFLEMLDDDNHKSVDISIGLNKLHHDCFKYNFFIFAVFSKISNKEDFPIGSFITKIPDDFFTKIENFNEIKNIFEKADPNKTSVTQEKRAVIIQAFDPAFEKSAKEKNDCATKSQIREFKYSIVRDFGSGISREKRSVSPFNFFS